MPMPTSGIFLFKELKKAFLSNSPNMECCKTHLLLQAGEDLGRCFRRKGRCVIKGVPFFHFCTGDCMQRETSVIGWKSRARNKGQN